MIPFRKLSLLITTVFLLFSEVLSFAAWFTQDEYCQRKLKTGEIIMNAPAFLSTDRAVQVRDEQDRELKSGDSVSAGAVLIVSLSGSGGQFVFEVGPKELATFSKSSGTIGCEGMRIAGEKDAKLKVTAIAPAAAEESDHTVRISAGANTLDCHPPILVLEVLSLD